jgi:hypothetical protein
MIMLDWFLVALVAASVVSVGLLFLPAIIEMKKPRDAGPRSIDDLSVHPLLNKKAPMDAESKAVTKLRSNNDSSNSEA